ncbi:hypothetical protein LOK74_08950 [Brevibacillus humidisoli]|uniref:hypothetical protein n=1 Tax=Brevibacillus humidisoli TaxID=2895522 RepID=UPI001E571F61|nr:hypothetical protein [Brevibacillus humidisoli]UFJ42600.1 hypothetical protein LOK74_08950 [Brevibacillus humidisoli]
MFQELNNQLAEMKIALRHQFNWSQRLQQLKEELKQEEAVRDQWHHQLLKEQKDVDRLTGLSFGALFFSLIGKKEDKLSKETEELLQAKLKYEEAVQTVQDLEQERTELEQKLLQLGDVKREIESLLAEKEQLIQQRHPALAGQLDELSEQETEVLANLRELQEAVSAGHSVLSALDQARERLHSAKSWGTWDMLGGGMISTAIKHSRIDEAREAIHAAQRSLRQFEKECNDVRRDVSVQIEIGGLLTFADYFFDGLISDWIVQGRISESLQQVDEKYSHIERIVNHLKAECRKAESEILELRSRSAALIENA